MVIMITWNITEIIKSCKEARNNYYHIEDTGNVRNYKIVIWQIDKGAA